MTIVEFEQAGTVRPVVHHPAAPKAKSGHQRSSYTGTEVAIIGAGPYGLSLAAQLGAQGIPFRIFGKPLETWREHMPKDMLLKSEGFATNLSHPSKESTLGAYCAARGIAYSDQALPVQLSLFVEYADWFRKTYVPTLEEQSVTNLEKTADGFALTLEDGSCCKARRVVLAVGITWFAETPDMLKELAPDAHSHSYDHRDGAQFNGKDVVVLGVGASAVDLAALLNDSGARVKIIGRGTTIRYHTPPGEDDNKLWNQLKNPPTTIGPGWRSWAAVRMPFLFRFLPENLRLEIVKRHLGPAPGWFVRQRVEGHVEAMLGYTLDAARMMGKRVLLRITDKRGQAKTVECDHIVAATGFKMDFGRVPFMTPALLSAIETTGGAPKLNGRLETSVKDLYVVGPAAANSFGPLLRFMTGAEWAAPFLAKRLARDVKR